MVSTLYSFKCEKSLIPIKAVPILLIIVRQPALMKKSMIKMPEAYSGQTILIMQYPHILFRPILGTKSFMEKSL
jgi:hypothetical protein